MRAAPSVLRGRLAHRRVNGHWLRSGLDVLAWAMGRSLSSSLHLTAARVLVQAASATEVCGEPSPRLAGSFVLFLFERYGMEKLCRFCRRAEKEGLETAARSTFGKGFFALQWDWEDMLRSLEV